MAFDDWSVASDMANNKEYWIRDSTNNGKASDKANADEMGFVDGTPSSDADHLVRISEDVIVDTKTGDSYMFHSHD